MREKETKREIEKMCPAQRCERAKTVLAGLNPRLIEAIGLNQANKIILFSDTLSKQIPESYAANAFNLFQDSLFRIEVITLCSLWDRADLDKHSIPLLRELLDNEAVLKCLLDMQVTASLRRPHNITGSPELDEVGRLHIQQVRQEQRVASANSNFMRAHCIYCRKLKALDGSCLLTKVRNLRHRYAHNFVDGLATIATHQSPVEQPKYADVDRLLEETIAVVKAAFLLIEQSEVLYEEAETQWLEQTEQLWRNCKFDIS